MSTEESWEGERAERWVRLSRGLERQLAPVSDVLFARAGLAAGERVLDVGCGTGPTTREAATRVGNTGRATGLDLVGDMLDAARTATNELEPADRAPIEWVKADATTWDAPDGSSDVVISRFGVMFFDDPPAAFANLARITAHGGRAHLAVWADRRVSPFFEQPLAAAMNTMQADLGLEVPWPGPDEGPFSLSNQDEVVAMLERAGWLDVAWEQRELELTVGGGSTPQECAAGAMDFGPVRAVTTELDDAQRAVVRDALVDVFGQHVRNGAVVLPGTVIIISARRGE